MMNSIFEKNGKATKHQASNDKIRKILTTAVMASVYAGGFSVMPVAEAAGGFLNNSKDLSSYYVLGSVKGGNTAYIDTGYKVTGSTVSQLTYSGLSISSARACMFGANSASSWNTQYGIVMNPSGGSGSGIWGYYISDTNYGHYSASGVLKIQSGTFYLNGSSVGSVGSKSFTISSRTMYLFNLNGVPAGGTYTFSATNFQILEGSTLKKNFVPIKKADGTIGMWDTVGGAFYGKNGSGSFSAGYAISGYSADSGGAIYNSNKVNLDGLTFSTNTASGSGGAVYNSGTLNISGSTFKNNKAKEGAALFSAGSSTTIKNSTFCLNTSTTFVGEAMGISGKSTVTIQAGKFFSNTSTDYTAAKSQDGNGAIVLYTAGFNLILEKSSSSNDNLFYNNTDWDIVGWSPKADSTIKFSSGTTYLNSGLYLKQSDTGGNINVTVGGTLHANKMQLNAVAGIFTVNSGGSVDNNYYATSGSGESMALTTGTVSGQGAFSMSTGTFTVDSGGTATLSNISVTGGTVTNAGTLSLGSGTFTPSTALTNTGIVALDSTIVKVNISDSDKAGTVKVSGGTVNLKDYSVQAKQVTVTSGATANVNILKMDVTSAKNVLFYANSGTMNIENAGAAKTITLGAMTTSCTAFAAVDGGGTLTLNGGTSGITLQNMPYANNSAMAVIKSENTSGTDTVNLNGKLNFTSNTTANDKGWAVITVTNADNKLNLNGTVTFSGNGVKEAVRDIFSNGVTTVKGTTTMDGGIYGTTGKLIVGDDSKTAAKLIVNGSRGAALSGQTEITVKAGATLDMSATTGSITGASSVFTNAGTLKMGSGTLNTALALSNVGVLYLYGTSLGNNITDTSLVGEIYVGKNTSGDTVDNTLTKKSVQAKQLTVNSSATFKSDIAYTDARVNVNSSGTAVLSFAGTTQITRKNLSATTWDNGSAVYNAGSFSVSGGTKGLVYDSYVSGTGGSGGGAFYNTSTGVMVLEGKISFKNNSAKGTVGGGAVYNNGGSVTIKGTTEFINNKDKTGNNDIYNTGTVTFTGNVSFDGGINGSSGSLYIGDDDMTATNTVTLTSAAGIDGQTTLVVYKDGNLDISSSSGTIGGVSSLFTNAGTMKTGTGEVKSNLTNTGTLTAAKAGTISGTVTNNDDAALFTVDGTTVSGKVTNTKGTVTLTSGKITGEIINSALVNVADASYLAGSAGITNATAASVINLNAGELSRDIVNKGTINMGNGTLNANITDTGIVNINGTVESKKNIANGVSINTSSDKLTVTSGNITGMITNVGTLQVNGGCVKKITNTATVNVTSADFLQGEIVNNTDGTVTVGSGTLTYAIGGTGGATVIDGSVVAGAAISNTGGIIVNSTKSLEIAAVNLQADTVNDGTLTLTGINSNLGANISSSGKTIVSGTVTNSNNKTITQNDLTVSGNFTTEVDKITIANTIQNTGSLTLSSDGTDDILQEAVTGTGGKVIIDGTITAQSLIDSTGGITVNSTKQLTIDADNIGSAVTNNGILLVQSDGTGTNTINNTVTGSGKIIIDGDITSTKSIATASTDGIVINSSKSLSIGGGNLNGVTYNSGKLTLTGDGALSYNIYGDTSAGASTYGDITVSGNISTEKEIRATNIQITGGYSLSMNAGNLYLDSTGKVDNLGTLKLTGGTLSETITSSTGTGTVEITGPVTLGNTTGNVGEIGTQNLKISGTLSVNFKADKKLAQDVTLNGGTLNLLDSGDYTYTVANFASAGGTVSFDMMKKGTNTHGDYLTLTDHDLLKVTGNAEGTLKLGSINMNRYIYIYQDGDDLPEGKSVGNLEFDTIHLIDCSDVSSLDITGTTTQYGDYMYTFTQDTTNRGDLKIEPTVASLGLREIINAQNQKEENSESAAMVGTYSFKVDTTNVKPYATYQYYMSLPAGSRPADYDATVAALKKQLQNIIKGNGLAERDWDWDGTTAALSDAQKAALIKYDELIETKGLGTLSPAAGRTKRILTINGNGKKLNGGGFAGVKVNEGGTLNIVSVSNIDSFKDNIVVDNDGTLTVADSIMQLNSGVKGTGSLQLSNSNITLGTFDNNEIETQYQLTQQFMTINSDSTLNVYASDLTITTINNKGTINLWGGKESGNRSLLQNTGITNNDGRINIAENQYINILGTASVAGQIDNKGTIYVEKTTNLTGGQLNNTGVLELNTGTLNIPVSGSGSTVITGIVTNNSTLTQDNLTVKNRFITPADMLTVANSVIAETGAVIELTGGNGTAKVNFANSLTGDGKTVINGDIIAEKMVATSGGINISATKSLTIDADHVGSEVTNEGVIFLTGDGKDKDNAATGTIDTLTRTVIGGSIVLYGDITADAKHLKGEVTNTANTLTVTGGTDTEAQDLTVAVKGGGNVNIGTATVAAFISAQQAITNVISVSTGSALTINGDNIQNDITNSGTLTVTGGEIRHILDGTEGNTIITGTVTGSSKITQGKLTVNSGAGLSIDINNLGIHSENADALTNNGSLTLGGTGTLAKALAGTGVLNVRGIDITVTKAVTNAVNISEGKKLTIAPNNLQNTVTDNSGTLYLNADGTLGKTVSGTGTLQTEGTITNTERNTITQKNLQIIGGTFKANAADLAVSETLGNNGELQLTGGSLSNNIQGSGIVNISTAAAEDTVKLAGQISQNVNVTQGILNYANGRNKITGDISIGENGTVEIGVTNTTGSITLNEGTQKGKLVFTTGGEYTKAIAGSGIVEIAREAELSISTDGIVTDTIDLNIAGTLDTGSITVRDLNIGQKGMLKLANGNTGNELKVAGNFISDSGQLNLDIDLGSVNVGSNQVQIITDGFDRIVAQGTVSGVLTLENINLVHAATSMGKGAYVQMQIVSSSGENTLTIGNSVAVTSDGAKYTFSQATETPNQADKGHNKTGYLQVYKDEGYSLYQIITGTKTTGDDYDPATLTNYILINNDWDAKDADEKELTADGSGVHMKTLGLLRASGSETVRDFTVSGNGYRFISTGEVTGMTVKDAGFSVNLNDISLISGFKNYVVKNEKGTINVRTNVGTEIESDIINDGNMNIAKGAVSISGNISGNGTTVIGSTADVTVTDEGRFTQKTLTVNAGGVLTTQADALTIADSNITNNGTVVFTGGTIANGLAGTGNIIIDGSVTGGTSVTPGYVLLNNICVNDVEIKANNTLTTDGANLQSTAVNEGTVELTGGTLGGIIKDGTQKGIIVLSGDVFAGGDCLASQVINSSRTLTVTGGNLTETIDGTNGSYGNLDITGNVICTNTITQQKITVTETGKLTGDISKLNYREKLTNNGTVVLNGNGTAAGEISGNGTMNLGGGLTVGANLTQSVLNITDATAVMTIAAGKLNVPVINNAGSLVLTGDDILTGSVSSYTDEGRTVTGTVVIDGNITAQKPINNKILIKDIADSLITAAGNIAGTVTNNGSVILTGDAAGTPLDNSINGGAVILGGGIVNNTDGNSHNIQTLQINNNAMFSANMNDLQVADDAVTNNGTIVMTGGTLKNAVITTNKGEIVNKPDKTPQNTYEIDTDKLKSVAVIRNIVTLQNALDNVVMVQPGGTLITKPDYMANGVILQSDVSYTATEMEITNSSNIIINEAGSFKSAVAGCGTITINKDVTMAEGAKFLPVTEIPAAGYGNVPVSGMNVVLNAQMSIAASDLAASGSGALQNLTIGDGGHLNLVNSAEGMLLITGNVTATNTGTAKLSLDVIDDNRMDAFAIGGNASGTITLGTVNIVNELITDKCVQDGDKYYFGYTDPLDPTKNIYLDKDGYITEELTERVELGEGGTISGTAKIAVWKDIPIGKTDNLTIIGTSVVSGRYRYTITYEENKDASHDKQLKITKESGFNLHQIIQGYIQPGTALTEEFKAAKIDTYSLTNDMVNVKEYNGIEVGGGSRLGILTRIDAGTYTEGGKSGGATNRLFTINGNGKKLNGGGWEGITVQEGDTLVLTHIAEVSNFQNGIVATNNGTVKLDGGSTNIGVGLTAEEGKGTWEINGAEVTLLKESRYLSEGAKSLTTDGTSAVFKNNSGNVIGYTDYVPTIKQNRLNLISGSLTASADSLQITTVTNDAALILEDKKTAGEATTLNALVEGTGTVQVNATNLTFGQKVKNNIDIASAGKLTTVADNIGGTVTNSGLLVLTGGTLGNTVSGGTLQISGNVNTAVTNLNCNLVTVDNSNTLELTGAELTKPIGDSSHTTGTVKFTDNMTLKANVYTQLEVAGGRQITSDAWFVCGDVTNRGTVTLTGSSDSSGILNRKISRGTVEIAGTITTDAANLDTDTVTVNKDKVLNLTGEGITEGTLSVNIDGEGTSIITGDITANAKLATTGGIIINGGTLTITGSNIGNTITNNGTMKLTGNTLDKKIEGGGRLILTDNFGMTEADLIAPAQNVTVSEGKTLGTNNTIRELANLTLADNSVLDMQNNIMETLTLTSFDTGSNGANLKIDVDLATVTNDSIVINGTGAGRMNIGSYDASIKGINLLSDLEGDVGTTAQITIIAGETQGLNLTNEIVSQLGIFKYTFTQTGTTGLYNVVKDYGKTLKEVVNNTDNSGTTSTYILLQDYTADKEMGYLTRTDAGENTEEGTVQRDFTIDMRQHKYLGGDQTGITISHGNTLTVQDAAEISNWRSYAFNNNGTLNLKNINSIQSVIIGGGTTTVTGDMTADQSIVQDTVTVNGGTLTANEQLNVNTLDGNGHVILQKNMTIQTAHFALTGGVTNNARLTLNGGADETSAAVLAGKIDGTGTTVFNGYTKAAAAQLGQQTENNGNLTVSGTGTISGISGTGDLTLTGTVENNIIPAVHFTDNVSAGTFNISTVSVTLDSGKEVKAAKLVLNGGSITLGSGNILNSDYTLLITKIADVEGNSGQLIIDLGGADYTATNFAGTRQKLFGNDGTEQAVLSFVNGNMIIDDDSTGQSTEALVVYGGITDNNITLSGIKPTVISTTEVSGTNIGNGTKMMEVDTTSSKLVAALKTRTVKVVENNNEKTVYNDLRAVDMISVQKNAADVCSEIIAKDLQIKSLASAETLTIVVGTANDSSDTSSLILVGDEDGIVKNAKEKSVATSAVVHKGAVFTVGEKKEEGEAVGNSGHLDNITVDGTFNVYGTALTIDRILKGITGKGIIFVDPSYLCIRDVSGYEDTKAWVDADGAVLNLGGRWTASELATIAGKMGYTTQTCSGNKNTDGFVVKGSKAVLAVGDTVNLGSEGALIASTSTTPYDKTTVKGVHFDADSIIIANAETAATDNGLIMGVTEMTNIADTSKLYIVADKNYKFKEGDVLTILSGPAVTENITYWDRSNITLSDKNFDIDEIQISGNKYQLKVIEIADSSQIADVVVAMRKENPQFKTFLKTLRTNYGSAKDAGYQKAVNAIGNLGEMAAVQHGTFTLGNQIGEAITTGIGLAAKPALRTERGYVMNTVSDIDDAKVEVVEQGQTGEIMPTSEIHMDKYAKEVWAGYMHNKENVTGLSLGGVDANYSATYKGVTVGADLWTDERIVFGAAIAYSDGNVTGSDNGVSSKNESKYYGISLYDRVTYDEDKALILDIGYIHSKNEIKQYNHGTQITADAKVNGITGGIRMEKSYKTGAKGLFVPFAGIRMMYLDNKSYTNNFGMEYSPEKQFIVMPETGLSWTAHYGERNTGMFTPNLQIGYVWNMGDRSTEQSVSFGGASDRIGYDVADSHNYFASIGAIYDRENFSIGIGYKYQKGSSVKNSKWNLNLGFVF